MPCGLRDCSQRRRASRARHLRAVVNPPFTQSHLLRGGRPFLGMCRHAASPSAIPAVLGLAAAPERWHYRLVDSSIGPRKESYRLPGRGAVTKRSAEVAPSTRRAFSLLCVLGLHGVSSMDLRLLLGLLRVVRARSLALESRSEWIRRIGSIGRGLRLNLAVTP